VSHDAVGAIIKEIELAANVNETLSIVVLSPCRAVAAAVRDAPWIVKHARIVSMGGSLRHGYNGTGLPIAEWNIQADVLSAQAVYTAAWPIIDAPLDTAGAAQITGAAYQRLLKCSSPLLSALLSMNRHWLPLCPWPSALDGPLGPADYQHTTSVLYDPVAATLLDFWQPATFVDLEDVKVRIASTGRMLLDPQNGSSITAAMRWRNFTLWETKVVNQLCKNQTTSLWNDVELDLGNNPQFEEQYVV